MTNQIKLSSQFVTLLLLVSGFSVFSYSAYAANNIRCTLKNANSDTIPKVKAKQKSKIQQEEDDGEPTLKSILQDELKS
jgi:hypothetical protein